MTQYLHDYFAGHTESAISGMKAALQAKSFYKRLEMRLQKGEDLKEELPVIAKVGNTGALEVVREAIKENTGKVHSVWNLPKKLQAVGTQKIDIYKEPYELIPRVVLTYRFKSKAGEVLTTITTAGENFEVDFKTKTNKMAAELSMKELEQQISFALLSS